MMICRQVTLGSRFGRVGLALSNASCTSASVTLAGTSLPSSRSFFVVRAMQLVATDAVGEEAPVLLRRAVARLGELGL